ncbi:ATP-binding protein [Streptomyces piniterrae]|uniref:ATP-binding protein n=1 Tax=Streptomyces piniterrae TaxID=2571125 RepID=UPI001FEA0442|nr:LuxR C-terminal-related transcriptional regulator [Streptomyces piniterrae]
MRSRDESRDGRARGGRPARYCSGACRQRAFRERATRERAGSERATREPTAGHPPERAAPRTQGTGLPRALDSFVGRERELARLRTLLRSARLLTLIGPGGVGKTRLALELARGVRGGREGGAQLVELDALRDGDLLCQAVAAALGAGERSGRAGVEAIVHALGPRPLLIVLDNCEHLVEGCARLAATLLARCPGLRILATSRETLRVPGEVVFRVGELSLSAAEGSEAGAGEDTTALLRSEAVRLFAERARAADPGFALGPGNARTVAEICRRLDGLPLAIELAAGRTGSLPLGDILRGLDDQLSLLTDGSRTGPGRHRELRAAIDWSYRLLDPVEQAVFRRLSVLGGGFDARGAAEVCAGGGAADTEVRPDQVLRVVCALEAKSLIVRMRQGDPDTARFRQLSAIRGYGMDRLAESGELHTTWHRALDRLAGQEAGAPEPVFADTVEGPLSGERENLAAAVAYTSGRSDSRYVPLAIALARLRYQQEQLTAARTVLSEVLDRASDGVHRGMALALAARCACLQADHTAALALADEAVAVERAGNRPGGLANALDALAAARLCRSEFAEAVAVFAECLDVVRTLGRPLDTALCRHHLAWALLHTGQATEADELMARCLPDLRAGAPTGQLTAALHTVGAIRLAQGDFDAAEDMFAEVLHTTSGETFHALYPLEGLAIVAGERGDMRRSLRLYAAAAAARRRLDTEPEAHWRGQVEAAAARARERVSSARAEAALEAGRRLRGDALFAYALRETGEMRETRGTRDGTGRADPDGVVSAVAPSPLTERESAVARLVAESLTNRQIAAHLGLSKSTVASHLDRVRDKLGLRSRTQIALWVASQTHPHPHPGSEVS